MTQEQKVLEYIDKHGTITSLEAFKKLYITRLSAIIYKLKKSGFDVRGSLESHTNKDGDVSYYKRYFIMPKDVTKDEELMKHIPRID